MNCSRNVCRADDDKDGLNAGETASQTNVQDTCSQAIDLFARLC